MVVEVVVSVGCLRLPPRGAALACLQGLGLPLSGQPGSRAPDLSVPTPTHTIQRIVGGRFAHRCTVNRLATKQAVASAEHSRYRPD
eukprot:5496004-Pyramimonas_sp.AAC.1